ncbi:MAG: DUF1887 family CARF protein [Chloroflexus sp.]|uniref:Card1-like endonuclease domain-containing protein n=1 Tax=Chloroflexus sp. TaxID=1904827 RepID=UPI0030B2331B
MSNVDMRPFKTKHLFILVGANPLPNYVAAKLLLNSGEHQSGEHQSGEHQSGEHQSGEHQSGEHQSGEHQSNGHLYLVHTSETEEIADRLIAALKLELKKTATKIPVDEANTEDIFNKVSEHARGKQNVGLNYTGGTKTMAVHAYRAVKEACPGAVFSYLDAKCLQMIIERPQSQQKFPVALDVRPTIEVLLALHGYQLHPVVSSSQSNVRYLQLCQVLAKYGIQWRQWCNQNLRSGPDTPFRKKAELSAVILPCLQAVNWQNGNTLGDLAAHWKLEVGELAEWLDGKWLEHYTLWELQQIASVCHIHQVGMNIQATMKTGSQNRHFEFDVVAMRGYQLFALSCSTEHRKGKLKLKLFEAYIRARQMGGEEARVGLVCCAPENNPDSSPSVIQTEIEESWDAQGKVRVFGAEHLPNLQTHLQDWFNSQP